MSSVSYVSILSPLLIGLQSKATCMYSTSNFVSCVMPTADTNFSRLVYPTICALI